MISTILNIFINFLLCLYGNPFYDNATYIAYQLNHLPLVFCWTAITVYGLYFYSDKIWTYSNYPYKKWMHKICCLLLLVGPFVPYSTAETWTNDFHVWLIALALIMFYIQWISFFQFQQKRTTLKKWFLIHTCINMALLFFFGHVTLCNQIYFSLSMNLLLKKRVRNTI